MFFEEIIFFRNNKFRVGFELELVRLRIEIGHRCLATTIYEKRRLHRRMCLGYFEDLAEGLSPMLNVIQGTITIS